MTQIVQSREGTRFTEAWEGVELDVYADVRGIATIGVGHAYQPEGPITEAERMPGLEIIPGVVTGPGGTITLAEALVLEQHDVEVNALAALRGSLRVPLDPGQVDALADVGFNCGPGSLAAAGDVMRAVNSKPLWAPVGSPPLAAWHAQVGAAIMEWDNPRVLLRRRESDVALFCTDRYTRATGNPYSNL
jgi:GH24 family phage-related lysozyme (muramidase)